jgi:hypothetical protein
VPTKANRGAFHLVTDNPDHLTLAQWSHITCDYPIPRLQRPLIPEVAGVYVCLTPEGGVAYIGESSDKVCPGDKRGLRGRITTSKILRDHYHNPEHAPMGAVWWFEMPGSTLRERMDFEKRLYEHYTPWSNFGSTTRVQVAKRHGFTAETWPAARPWHGADTDHPGDCATWASRLDVERRHN